MPRLNDTLDRAGAALRRSMRRVGRGGRGLAPLPDAGPSREIREPNSPSPSRRGDSVLDQSIAALRAVVWIAAFVQGVFNEIRGRSDDL